LAIRTVPPASTASIYALLSPRIHCLIKSTLTSTELRLSNATWNFNVNREHPQMYMAPEVIGGSHYPQAADVWSIGIIAHMLLCERPPFWAESQAELAWQIQVRFTL
jgi:serine/threonine protein kinase